MSAQRLLRASHFRNAFAATEKPVYKGMYGDWSVEDDDVREVIAYKAGLNIAALGTASCSTAPIYSMLYAQLSAFLGCSNLD